MLIHERFLFRRAHDWEWFTILLIVASVSCGQKNANPIRIATTTWPGAEFIHLAHSLGYFDDEGVAVRLIEFFTVGDARRAFEHGQVDVANCTNLELILVNRLSDRQASIFFVTDFSHGSNMLLARPGLEGLGDLRGKRIAADPGTIDILALVLALESVGMTLADVQLTPLPQNAMANALHRGEVDAVQTYPPFSNKIYKKAAAIKLFDSSRIPMQLVGALLTDQQTLHERTDDLAKILRAILRAQEYYRERPGEATQQMAERLDLIDHEFTEAMSGIRIVQRHEQDALLSPGSPLDNALNVAHRVLQQTGTLDRPIRKVNWMSNVPNRRAKP
ncbi:MAG: ABC transporter substrate-binding protein [Planctomycetota bacterium]